METGIPIPAFISLGGNMGDEPAVFACALSRMAAWPGVSVAAASGLYRTQPQGDADQPWFHNQVAMLACSPAIHPTALLEKMLALEKDLGRVRDAGRRFGPRVIDLDLLLFGGIVLCDARLCLPHPRMAQRAFVLVPLLEIAPWLRLPDGTPVAACLEQLRYTVKDRTIFQEGGGKDTHGKSR